MIRRIVARRLAMGVAMGACLAIAACASRETCPASAARDPEACARSGCPRFATGDAEHGCACASGVLLAGGCVAPKVADAYCGRAAYFENGACVFRACPAGQRLDLESGACVGARAQRDVAAAQHLAVGAGELLACDRDRAPAIDGLRVACLPEDARCPRGTSWIAGKCARPARCGAGEALDAESGQCLRLLVRAPGDERYRVDVARWLRLVVGPEGGAGSASMCTPIAQRPSLFGVPPKGRGRLRVSVELAFPDSDVTAVYARVDATDDVSGRAITGDALAAIDAATQPLVEGLRALGGVSTAATLRTSVRCLVAADDVPHGVPESEDAGAP